MRWILMLMAALPFSAGADCSPREVAVAAFSGQPSPAGKSPAERRDSLAKALLAQLEAAPDAKLYALPEAGLSPLPNDVVSDFKSPAEARPFAFEIPPGNTEPTEAPLASFAAVAKKRGAFIHLGLLEREKGTDHIYNTVVVLGPNGKIRAKHRKVNLSQAEGSSETSYITPGPHRPTSYDGSEAELGEVGAAICADIYDSGGPPHLMEKYRIRNPSLMVVSAEWQAAQDPDPGHTRGWGPMDFFGELGQYLNHGAPLNPEARFPEPAPGTGPRPFSPGTVGTTPFRPRTDGDTYTLVSNATDPAPGAGLFGPDGKARAARTEKEMGWVVGCVPKRKAGPLGQTHRKDH